MNEELIKKISVFFEAGLFSPGPRPPRPKSPPPELGMLNMGPSAPRVHVGPGTPSGPETLGRTSEVRNPTGSLYFCNDCGESIEKPFATHGEQQQIYPEMFCDKCNTARWEELSSPTDDHGHWASELDKTDKWAEYEDPDPMEESRIKKISVFFEDSEGKLEGFLKQAIKMAQQRQQ